MMTDTWPEMLAEYLGPDGFSLRLAFTAKEGLDCANEGGIVLVVLDVMLPDRDGFSARSAKSGNGAASPSSC